MSMKMFRSNDSNEGNCTMEHTENGKMNGAILSIHVVQRLLEPQYE